MNDWFYVFVGAMATVGVLVVLLFREASRAPDPAPPSGTVGREARAARRARRARERFEAAVVAWDASRAPRPAVPLGALGVGVPVPPVPTEAGPVLAFARGTDGQREPVLGGAPALAQALRVVRESVRNGRRALNRIDDEIAKRDLFARYEAEADELYKDGVALSVPKAADEDLEAYEARLGRIREMLRARIEPPVTPPLARVRQTSDKQAPPYRGAIYVLTRRERKSLRRAFYDRYGAFPSEDELRQFVAERRKRDG